MLAAFRAGADGVLLSRKYSEMRLENLRAARCCAGGGLRIDMDIKAFLSSTRLDLDPDCRPAALDGIQRGGATAVAMETWVVPYGDPVEICREKLKSDSTHYVGVFAYRYGSRVPDNSMSITEAEFAFARDAMETRQLAVFVPDPKCDFAAILRTRALDQSPEEDKAQRAFLDAIRRSGAHTTFTASHDLYQRVKTMVEQWNKGPLRQTLRVDSRQQPEESDICELGRVTQGREFEEAYAALAAGSGPEVAAFVIHGGLGMGHREIAARVRNSFERSTNSHVLKFAASVSPVWRGEGLRALLSVLGRALQPGFSPASVDEYAGALIERLKTSHVLLTIHDVQRFANAIEGFGRLLSGRRSRRGLLKRRKTLSFASLGWKAQRPSRTCRIPWSPCRRCNASRASKSFPGCAAG